MNTLKITVNLVSSEYEIVNEPFSDARFQKDNCCTATSTYQVLVEDSFSKKKESFLKSLAKQSSDTLPCLVEAKRNEIKNYFRIVNATSFLMLMRQDD